MRIAVTQFMSLDGVTQGPGAADEDPSEGFTRGGWFTPHLDEGFVGIASAWLDSADGLLLGRRTYEAFARDWPLMTDPRDPFAARMNALPKYVVTSTLTQGAWHPTTILRGDPATAVASVREQPGNELQIHGSARLAGALLRAGLVDTLRLAVAPTVVGQGRRLFPESGPDLGMTLRSSRATESGIAVLEYEATGIAIREDFVSSPAPT